MVIIKIQNDLSFWSVSAPGIIDQSDQSDIILLFYSLTNQWLYAYNYYTKW